MNNPSHIGIIMDGNGRWAQARGRTRVFGHIKGARTAKKIIEHCSRLKIKCLTLYAFSTENWQRPMPEVSFLMQLLKRHLNRETKKLMENNIRFTYIGNIDQLPAPAKKAVLQTQFETRNNTGMTLIFALSYGSRQEIVQATRRLAQKVQDGDLSPSQIDESLFQDCLQTSSLPDPDLIIRTSGEQRLSNFMLWQSAYSEFYFSSTLWPDFDEICLDEALDFYNRRERRFGKISGQGKPDTANEKLALI